MAEGLKKWCRVCVREVTGDRRKCARCKSRERRGQPPAEPEAQLVRCTHCHRSFALPFGVVPPETCSARCERRLTEWRAVEVERAAARAAWEASQVAQHEPPVPEPEPVYERRLVREVDPRTPWQSREVWRDVRVG